MARVKIRRRRLDREHVDVVGEPVVQSVLDFGRGKAPAGLDVGDLRKSVHSLVRPSGAADDRVFPE